MRKTSYLLLVVVIILLSFSSVFAKPNFVTYLHDVEALQLDDNNPMVNYEGYDFGIGESSLGDNIFRSLLYFDLSSIPSNAILSYATINLVASSDVSTSGTVIYCYRLLVPFSVSEATWVERFFSIAWDNHSLGSSDVDLSSGVFYTFYLYDVYQFDTISLIADFSLLSSIIDGTYSNYGFACTTNNETDDLFTFYGSDSSYKPSIQIEYSLPATPTSMASLTPTSTATFTFTPSPTFTFTPLPTFTFTPTPSFTPTPTNTPTPTGFPTEMGLSFYVMLILPLLFIDWQIGLIWAVISVNSAVVSFFESLPFEGLEVWFIFLLVGFLRLVLFRNR